MKRRFDRSLRPGWLNERSVMLLVVGIAFLTLLIRNSGLYPFVFADEYYYSRFARLIPLSEAPLPNYLYFAVFHLTNACGDDFLGCARILNAVFFVGASPFIYLTARRHCNMPLALFVAALSLAAPVSSYTVYFMPEAFYFFGFWVVTWYFLRLDASAASRQWAVAGMSAGVLSLIKPHALFMLPAMLTYCVYRSLARKERPFLEASRNASIVLGVAILTKLVFGFALAGQIGVTLFGSLYTNAAASATNHLEQYLHMIVATVTNAVTHLLAIVFMFGVPSALAMLAIASRPGTREPTASIKAMSLFVSTLLITLIMVASLLTVSLGALDPEQAFRLHMRYYDFIFPLFLIVAAAGLSQAPHEMPTWRRCVVAAPIGMAIVYIGYTRFAPYRFSFVDSPELSGMMFKIAPFFILCAIALLSVVVWSIASRKGSAFFLFVFAPCSILGATYYNNMQLRPLGEASVYDKAGMFVRQYLSPDERSRLIVTGEEVSGLFRSLFFIDQRDASYEAVAKGADYDASRAANDKKWLLVFGSEPSELAGARALRMRGFTLFELPDDNDFHYAASLSEGIDFRRRGFPLFVDNVSGLSGREIWGRWSDANIAPTVRIAFAQALPRHFVLRLSGTAYGPNIGKSLAIMVGAKRYEAPMPGAAFDMRLPVDLDDDQTRAVEFRPPAPISPDGLDKSQGGRRIGVGFVHLAVELR